MANPDKRLRLYKQLLSLYPKAYREQFGDQILQTSEDMLGEVTDKKTQRKLWLRLALDMQINVCRQQVKYLGGYMSDMNQRMVKTVLYVGVSGAAILALPYLRAIGTTWIDTAGLLRMVGLSLFVMAFIVTPLILAAFTLLSRTKHISPKIQGQQT